MNIVGKILVILNLVFAVVVGGFLVVDFATRTNWRDAHKKLEAEMSAANAHWKVMSDTHAKYENNLKTLKQNLDIARAEIVAKNDELSGERAKIEVKLIDADLKTKDAETTAKSLQNENIRIGKLHENLVAVLKQRDAVIVDLQADVVKYRNVSVQLENQSKITQDRNEQLLAQNVELTKELQKARTPGGDPDNKITPGKANPPAVYVEGKIEAVHKDDNGLVQLTVGSDKGLVKNQTLEVYRFNPSIYLGMIRIVDVQPHTAVGRLERTGNANKTPLRAGDTVASSLTRN